RLRWDTTKMSVFAKAGEVGDISTDIPVMSADGPERIAVNIKFLLEYLKGKEGVLTIGANDRKSPLVLHYQNLPLVAIMPMHIAWDDDPVEEKPAEKTDEEDPPDATVLLVPTDSEAYKILQVEKITAGELRARIKESKEEESNLLTDFLDEAEEEDAPTEENDQAVSEAPAQPVELAPEPAAEEPPPDPFCDKCGLQMSIHNPDGSCPGAELDMVTAAVAADVIVNGGVAENQPEVPEQSPENLVLAAPQAEDLKKRGRPKKTT
nr:hypothetical protein [Dehalococcoidales bacterium]